MAGGAVLRVMLPLLLLAGCTSSPPQNDAAEAEGQAVQGNDAGALLEQAAISAGLVPEKAAGSAVGLYRRRHEAGRDSLCLLPASDKADDAKMRFGLEARFGENIECRGRGMARQSGDSLILNFDGSACLVVARYEGDRIAFPGVIAADCAKLCSERGTLEGVSFPRVSQDASVAAAARGEGGEALCPAA